MTPATASLLASLARLLADAGDPELRAWSTVLGAVLSSEPVAAGPATQADRARAYRERQRERNVTIRHVERDGVTTSVTDVEARRRRAART